MIQRWIMLVLAALCLINSVDFIVSGTEYVTTPIGERPSQCVHFAEEDKAILKIKDGVTIVYYPESQRVLEYPSLPECVENANEIMSNSTKNKNNKGKKGNYQTWVDYASSTVPAMGTFTATYTLPNQDPTDSGELLYYFIGLQNDDDTDVTIIQPVIVYCGNCGSWSNGWSMVPWNCCPNGQSWYGSDYTVPSGADIQAYVLANDTTVVVSSTYEEKTTTLVVSDKKRTFDWAAATLEEYSVTSCELYPNLPFVVSDMKLVDEEGRSVTPNWEATNDARCDGGVKIIDEQTVDIYGRDLPN